MIPYGKQTVDEADIAAVVEVLRSDWLTTGPKVAEFEKALAASSGVPHAVAVCNGTAALHCAMHALGVGPGDEVIVSTMSFAASANCIVFQGGTPVFADVRDEDLLIDPKSIEQKITRKTKAIIAVDYAGLPCDYDALRAIAHRHGLALVSDACHSLGGAYKGRIVGSLADITVFSFHPVKNITTGEGGALVTDNAEYARRARLFRNHGITSDFRERQESGSWEYDMVDLGWNYRITDFQCALGLSQLEKLPVWIARRNEIAALYDSAFRLPLSAIRPLTSLPGPHTHAYHLYVVRVPPGLRAGIFAHLRRNGIGVNVHYRPIHLHPFYRQRFGTGPGLCPVAERAYGDIISLPMFAGLSDADVKIIIAAATKAVIDGE